MEVLGLSCFDEIEMYETWVTGEQLFEIYTAELEHELVNAIKNGQTPTLKMFVDTNPNHPRRRIADYLMFTEGIYMRNVNNTSTVAERLNPENNRPEAWSTYYEFTSETPFQDLMRMKNPVEITEWTGTYEFPWE